MIPARFSRKIRYNFKVQRGGCGLFKLDLEFDQFVIESLLYLILMQSILFYNEIAVSDKVIRFQSVRFSYLLRF